MKKVVVVLEIVVYSAIAAGIGYILIEVL